MTPDQAPKDPVLGGFRKRLLGAMMLVVTAVATIGLLFAQRYVGSSMRRDFEREFHGQLDAIRATQEVRDAELAEKCRALARRPRIHAALEDGAIDLLYPSARDELGDVMERRDAQPSVRQFALAAAFYRFLDRDGRVITPQEGRDIGTLTPGEEAQLSLGALPAQPQTGYLVRTGRDALGTVDEVITMPIFSTESGEAISAVVLGFRVPGLGSSGDQGEALGGMWLAGELMMPGASDRLRAELSRALPTLSGPERAEEGSLEAGGGEGRSLVFFRRLNPGSLYPPAYRVSAYSLAPLLSRQRRLAWQFGGAWALLVALGLAASHTVSGRFSRPVEKLAADSTENRERRFMAEAALEMKSRELQRSARFSADASHQLKTPVTVLRAGLEELLAGDSLKPEAREEVSGLVHQTFRLAGIIDDLLLLSRMDAGRLEISFEPIDLSQVIDGLIDDLGALPNDMGLSVESGYPPGLRALGEPRFVTLILQNVLENARKYNRKGGRIRVTGSGDDAWTAVRVANTGRQIPPHAQEHIFERFHRGSVGEDVPGNGIGLNLARELAHLHRGELSLVRSDGEWTEFELRLQSQGGASQ